MTATPTALVARLLDPAAYPHPVRDLRCIETHISWVLLTGDFAYKIKKPVAMGFLDFSTLALRHAACLDELRLNRRFAARLYVDVVPIAGPAELACVGAGGEAIEYAVRMRQFAQADQLDRLLDAGALGADDVARAAQAIARFHAGEPRAAAGDARGSAPAVGRRVAETFAALRPLVANDDGRRALVERLIGWQKDRFAALEAVVAARQRGGFVRECHGDLHLGNLVRLGAEIVPFDCIEFSAELRWIDVMADVAFLMMDLLHRGHPRHAFAMINAYLETGGDYAGVALLRYYLVYRAGVRALVALLRRDQIGAGESAAAAADDDAAAHLRLAQALAAPPRPMLFLMHGLSGSGKSSVSAELMTTWPALRVRSDVERKRLLGLGAEQSTRSAPGADAYAGDVTAATYRCLEDAAATALRAGFSIIVDAASLRRAQRAPFRSLAAAHGAAFAIIDCVAPDAELHRRLRERSAHGSDASEADESILDLQQRNAEPLDADERAAAITIDAAAGSDPRDWLTRIRSRF